MKMTAFLALIGALALPASLIAQDPAARIEGAKQRVAEVGIPVALLDDRVAEGRAKGVPLERIADAVERRAQALQAAHGAMRGTIPGARPAELAAGADAIEAGVPGSALREVMIAASPADRPVALAVLTFLHREQGLPVDQAVAQVTAAIQRGPAALRDLPAQAAAGQRRGPPADRPGPPSGTGPPSQTGPPSGVPGPGQRPGAGRPGGGPPDHAGPPDGGGPPGQGGPPGGGPPGGGPPGGQP